MRKANWTRDKIKQAFERFFRENNRLPTALEVDTTDDLPSSRHIQREFGGLKKLRAELGYTDCDFGTGIHRSQIAHRVNHRGRDSEIDLETKLRDRFGEVFVHTEKIFNDHKTRVDFYVYTETSDFGVDIFYPDNMRTLQSNLNIKIKKYTNFPVTLYYVIANTHISQSTLDAYIANKKLPLEKNQRLVTQDTFIEIIEKYYPYPNPLNQNKK
jgi:hypothetical protein